MLMGNLYILTDQEIGSNASLKASDLCNTESHTKNEDEIELDEEDSDEDINEAGTQNEPTKKISLNLPPPKHEESILPKQKKFPMNLPPPKHSSEPMDCTENKSEETTANEEPVKKTLKRRNAAIYSEDQE